MHTTYDKIVEIYLKFLDAGNIEIAKAIREELPFWPMHTHTETTEYPNTEKVTAIIDETITEDEDDQGVLDSILKKPDETKEQVYCYYFRHKALTGFNPLFYKHLMLTHNGHYFCSWACKKGYMREDGPTNAPGSNPLKLNGRWSRKHVACTQCGSTKRKHMGKGLCTACYFNKSVPIPKDETLKVLTAVCANTQCPNKRVPYLKEHMFQRNELYFCSKRCRDTDL